MGFFSTPKWAEKLDEEIRENRRINALENIGESLKNKPIFCDLCGKEITKETKYRCQGKAGLFDDKQNGWTGQCTRIVCKNCSEFCNKCNKHCCNKHFEKHKCKK